MIHHKATVLSHAGKKGAQIEKIKCMITRNPVIKMRSCHPVKRKMTQKV